MCGIAGLWSLSGALEGIDSAIAALEHRGPDSNGKFVDKSAGVALGHVRLAIIDLSPLGSQPMISDDGSIVLIFNGEIYNFRELRSELEAAGVKFRGHSDTEVILRLYQATGLDMLRRLNGVFAFAIYDMSRHELVVVRDGLGVKPLYMAHGVEGFAFASEIKALRFLGVDLGRIDLSSIESYLTFLWNPGSGTMYSAVQKLGPGEFVRVVRGTIVEHRRWYTPAPLRLRANDISIDAAVNGVRDGLRNAVRRQMVADVPVGAFLSGGLDSSAIVAFAREQAEHIRCFTIETTGGRDAGEVDDLPYARLVANHLHVDLDVVSVSASHMAAAVEQMVWQLDEPLADPAPLNVLFIAQLARECGIKVLLSGAGGDDLFSGYRRHLAVRHQWLWSWMPSVFRKGLVHGSGWLDKRSGFGRRVGRLFSGAENSGDRRIGSYFSWISRDSLYPLFTSEVRSQLAEGDVFDPMLAYLRELPEDYSPLSRMLALEQRFFLADHNLMYTDKMSMAAGVEVRVPFLDLELVDFAATIPDKFKQKGAVGKFVLKKAMEEYLPSEVIYRPKTGFGAPLRRWMRHELKEMLCDLLSPANLRRRGLFDANAVQALISDNDSGRRDGAYTLFSLLCIEIWCRRFIDAGSTASAHAI